MRGTEKGAQQYNKRQPPVEHLAQPRGTISHLCSFISILLLLLICFGRIITNLIYFRETEPRISAQQKVFNDDCASFPCNGQTSAGRVSAQAQGIQRNNGGI